MDVGLVEPMRQDCAGEVRVALEVEGRAADELVDVRVASGAEEVVNAAPYLIDAIRRQRVLLIISNVEPLQSTHYTVRLCATTYRSNCDHRP